MTVVVRSLSFRELVNRQYALTIHTRATVFYPSENNFEEKKMTRPAKSTASSEKEFRSFGMFMSEQLREWEEESSLSFVGILCFL